MIGRGGPIDLYMGLNTAGRLQYLTQDNVAINGVEQADLEPGFQTAWGSMEFLANLYDGDLEVYFDLYLSSMPHPNQLQGHEGYMLMRQIPGAENTLVGDIFKVVNVQGRPVRNRLRRPPLPSDRRRPGAAQPVGGQLCDRPKPPRKSPWKSSIPNPAFSTGWSASAVVRKPVASATDRDIATHGKIWLNFDDGLRLAGSAYHVNHGPNSHAMSNLYRASRSGGVYGGVLDGGNAPGQVFVGRARMSLAFQGDVSWIKDDVELYGNLGWIRRRSSEW